MHSTVTSEVAEENDAVISGWQSGAAPQARAEDRADGRRGQGGLVGGAGQHNVIHQAQQQLSITFPYILRTGVCDCMTCVCVCVGCARILAITDHHHLLVATLGDSGLARGRRAHV